MRISCLYPRIISLKEIVKVNPSRCVIDACSFWNFTPCNLTVHEPQEDLSIRGAVKMNADVDMLVSIFLFILCVLLYRRPYLRY
jgi:hypothetical protein